MNKEQFEKISKWRKQTFGKSEPKPLLLHLKEELEEVDEALTCEYKIKRLEFADSFMLLYAAAEADGMSYEDICAAIDEKFEQLLKRKWKKPDANGIIRHVRDEYDHSHYMKYWYEFSSVRDFYLLNRYKEPLFFYNKGYATIAQCESFDTLPEHLQKIVDNELELARDIQQEIIDRPFPTEGDVVMINNEPYTITVRPFVDDLNQTCFQAIPGVAYHYRHYEGAGGSFSGTCGDIYKTNELVYEGQCIESIYWFFADRSSGADRGLQVKGFVKIYEMR